MESQVHSVFELEEAIERLLSEVCQKAGADAVAFHYYDETHDRLILPVGVGLKNPERFKSWLPSMDRVAGKIVRSGKPIFAEDAGHHPETAGPFVFAEGVKSSAGFPLITNPAETLGVLFFNYRTTRSFSAPERETLEMLAAEVAVAIQRLLTPELKAQLAIHPGLPREETALQGVADSVARALGDVAVAIWTPERDGQTLVIKACSGPTGKFAQGTRLNLTQSSAVIDVFKTGKPFDARIDDEPVFKDEARMTRWQGVSAFPVLSGSRVLGVCCIWTVGYHGLTERQKTLVGAFIELAARTIESERIVLMLNVLQGVGARLTFMLADPESLMREIVRSAAQILGADNITLHQYDPETRQFYDIDRSVTYGATKPLQKPREEGGASARVRDQGLVIIENMDEVPQADREMAWTEHVMEEGVKAYLGVRLRANEATLGVLFLNYLQPRRFTPDEIAITEAFAHSASLAIHHARLFQRASDRAEELDALNQVGQKLTSGIRLQGSQILELIYEQTSRLMDARNMYVALYDPVTDGMSFGLAFEDGKRMDVERGAYARAAQSSRKGATRAIIETKKPLLFKTAEEAREWYSRPGHEEYTGSIPEKYGYIGVPMMIGERVLGVISVRNRESDNVYNAPDLQVLLTIASQAAIALDNARLYGDTQERVQELEGLYSLATAIVRESDQRQLLNTIVTQTAQLLKADTATVCPYDSETGEFDMPVAVFDELPQPRPRKGGTTTKIIREGKIVWSDDTRSHELWRKSEFVRKRGVKSCAAMPLVVEDQPVGVLFLNYFDPHHFEESELRLLQAIGDQAALAIAKAGLQAKRLQRLYNRLTLVSEIVRERGVYEDPASYVGHVLQQTMELIPQVSGATYQSYDPGEQVLTLLVSRPQATTRTYDKISIQDGVSGEAIREKEMVYYPDVSVCPHYLPLFDGTASELAVPIVHDEEPFGVLNFESVNKEAFSSHDIEILKEVANVAASAIYDRFRTYELYQEKSRREVELVKARVARAAVHAVGNKASKIEIYADHLLGRLDLSDDERQRLGRILDHATGINDLISELVGGITPSELVDVCQAIIDAVNFADIEEGIQLINQVQEELPPVDIERNEFCTTIVELITNAQKAMEDVVGEGWIKIQAEVTGDGKLLDIFVSNNGPPIPREDWEVVFSGEYYPRDQLPHRPGARKGLFLARDFLSRYNGTLKIVRSDSEVTMFQIQLPVAIGDEQQNTRSEK